jgi:hypothetical protein
MWRRIELYSVAGRQGLPLRANDPIRRAMNRTIGHVQLLFLGIFAVAVAGIWAYQGLYASPAKACETSGNWWDNASRTCGHVIYLPDVTHRPPGAKTPVYPSLPKSVDAAAQATSLRR